MKVGLVISMGIAQAVILTFFCTKIPIRYLFGQAIEENSRYPRTMNMDVATPIKIYKNLTDYNSTDPDFDIVTFASVKKYVEMSIECLNKNYKKFMIDQVDSVIITRYSIELVIFDLKDVYETKGSELTIKKTKGRSMTFDILKVKKGIYRTVEIIFGAIFLPPRTRKLLKST